MIAWEPEILLTPTLRASRHLNVIEQLIHSTVPSDLPGAQAARHEPRRIAWTPQAKQISDRICVTGSRSTSI